MAHNTHDARLPLRGRAPRLAREGRSGFLSSPGDLVEHLAKARHLRSSSAASSQGAPLDITELVEQTKEMITGAAELAVIGADFMHSIGQVLVGKPCRARSSLDAAAEDRHGRQIGAIEVRSTALRELYPASRRATLREWRRPIADIRRIPLTIRSRALAINRA